MWPQLGRPVGRVGAKNLVAGLVAQAAWRTITAGEAVSLRTLARSRHSFRRDPGSFGVAPVVEDVRSGQVVLTYLGSSGAFRAGCSLVSTPPAGVSAARVTFRSS